ncbi:MAG: hypothetical protein KJZ83_00150 [Burkholderiaceae bacterium]|nr:hypothetical protein [Burkholderiaceae bacterium]
MRIVFTGPAVDGYGRSILRANLIKACEQAGMEVHCGVRADTTVLVASRIDTAKAARATERGLTVMTYPQFIGTYLRGTEIAEGGEVNPYTSKVDLDLLVPDFTEVRHRELIDQR